MCVHVMVPPIVPGLCAELYYDPKQHPEYPAGYYGFQVTAVESETVYAVGGRVTTVKVRWTDGGPEDRLLLFEENFRERTEKGGSRAHPRVDQKSWTVKDAEDRERSRSPPPRAEASAGGSGGQTATVSRSSGGSERTPLPPVPPVPQAPAPAPAPPRSRTAVEAAPDAAELLLRLQQQLAEQGQQMAEQGRQLAELQNQTRHAHVAVVAQAVFDQPANQQTIQNIASASGGGAALPWQLPLAGKRPKQTLCANWRPGGHGTCKSEAEEPAAVALTPQAIKELRAAPRMLREVVRTKATGQMGVGGGASSISRMMVCKRCVSQADDRAEHALLGTAGCNGQCMLCRKIWSSSKRDWKEQGRVCCKPAPSAETGDIGGFVDAVLAPVKALLKRYGLTMTWNYNMETSSGNTVDVPIKVTDQSGRIVEKLAVELDTDQHRGGAWPEAQERTRVKAVLEGYRDADRRGMIHFSMIGDFQAGQKKHRLKDTLTRWLILQSWVIDAVLHRAKYPAVWALYLFYDDESKRIVWPLKGGVCGNAYLAPRDDNSVGDGASVADWGSTLDPSMLVNSQKRGGEGREYFSIDRLVVRRDVFGPEFGPKAKCTAREDRMMVYTPNEL